MGRGRDWAEDAIRSRASNPPPAQNHDLDFRDRRFHSSPSFVAAAPMSARRFIAPVSNFLAEEDGPTAVEYAVMLAFIFMAVVGTVALLGQATKGAFSEASTKLSAN